MVYQVGLGDTGLGLALTEMPKSQLASFATSTAGGLTAASLALVGLGPIGALVAIGTQLAALLISQFKGCGQTCILTSNAANEVEKLLKQNLELYFASDRSYSVQQQALANFDNTWNQLVQYCSNPQFGQAGTNCVQDRQAGACKWKNAGGLTPAGSGNQCWNWFTGYRDPIANDPNVRPDNVTIIDSVAHELGIQGNSFTDVVNSINSNIAQTTGINGSTILIGLAALVGIGFLMSGR